MSDESTLEGAAETTPETTAESTGVEPTQTVETAESEATSTDSQPTLESLQAQVEELQKAKTHGDQKITELGQQASDWRNQANQYQLALQQLSGAVQQQSDPRIAAKADLKDAFESFDAERMLAAQDRLLQLEREQIRNDAVTAAAQAAQVQHGVIDAQRFGVNSANDLTGVQPRTPTELAIVKVLQEKGEDGLFEVLNASRKAREEESQRRSQLDGLLNGSGARNRPGTVPDQNDSEKPVNSLHWLAMSPAARKRVYGDVQPTVE